MKGTLILCINLASSTERKERMYAQSSALGIDVRFIEAVDGRTNDIENFTYKISKGYLDWKNFELSKPQLGCILSHRKCLDIFLESSLDYLIVLEDDAKFTDGVIEKIAQLKALPFWDLIKLETRHKKLRGYTVHQLPSGERLHASIKGDIGTTALLYNRRGAEKMISTLQNLRLPMDIHIAHYPCWRLKVLDLYPPIIVTDDRGESSIGNNSTTRPGYRKKSFEKIIGQCFWSIYRTVKAKSAFFVYNASRKNY